MSYYDKLIPKEKKEKVIKETPIGQVGYDNPRDVIDPRIMTGQSKRWEDAYNHSQIAGGDSVHVSVAENTSWDAAATASHTRQHAITQTLDHTSAATSGQMLKADANGLPVNATNTDAAVSAAVTASHAQSHTMASHSDDDTYNISTSGTANIGTNTLSVGQVAGKVGIGTTNPGYNLDIQSTGNNYLRVGTTDGTGAAGVIFANDSATRWCIYSAAGTSALNFYYTTLNALTLLQSGNIGIGTTSPTALLHISGNTATSLKLTNAQGSGVGIDLTGLSNGYSFSIANNQWIRFADTGGTQRLILGVDLSNQTWLASPPGGDVGICSEGIAVQGITVKKTTGNVGIGTTSPGYGLHVANSIADDKMVLVQNSNSSYNTVFRVRSSADNKQAGISFGNNTVGKMYMYKPESSGDLAIYDEVNSKELARIQSGGNVGIGTAAPDAPLEIETTTTTAIQALTLDQNDEDIGFIDYQGTSEAGASKNVSSWTVATIKGFVKVEVNGTAGWMPIYNAPTS